MLVTIRSPDGRTSDVSPKVAALLSHRGFRVAHGPSGPLLDVSKQEVRPLKVLAHVHRYPPIDNAGAEVMLHACLRHMAANGHDVKVLTPAGPPPGWDLDGLEVVVEFAGTADKLYGWADVAITHLDKTQVAAGFAQSAGVPLVHLVHNERQLDFWSVRSARLIIVNSRWLYEDLGWTGPQVIVRPPVAVEDYKVPATGDAVTLINLTREKGAELFYTLAERLPGTRFLGVKGAYGRQEVRPRPNVEIMEQQTDVRVVYAQTRILLVPSTYESWGRVGIEACCSGIPVIANPTPGLEESLDSAGIFIDYQQVDGWVAEIERLADPKAYAAAARKVRARAKALDPSADLETFERAMCWAKEGP